MSESEIKLEKMTDNPIYFHGKDIRSIRFQKKINRRHSLARVVLFNLIILILIILILWILTNLTI